MLLFHNVLENPQKYDLDPDPILLLNMDLDPDPIQQLHLGSRSRSNPLTDPFEEHFLMDHAFQSSLFCRSLEISRVLLQVTVDFQCFLLSVQSN